jgi:tetrahydromethanopterin S-methyltransferase subunit G
MTGDTGMLDEHEILDIKADIKEIKKRVFNGMALELRREIERSVGGVRTMVIGILISMLLGLSAIVIEGRISANAATQENLLNYKAILDLDMKVDRHIGATDE